MEDWQDKVQGVKGIDYWELDDDGTIVGATNELAGQQGGANEREETSENDNSKSN